jgi:hypothetical protein
VQRYSWLLDFFDRRRDGFCFFNCPLHWDYTIAGVRMRFWEGLIVRISWDLVRMGIKNKNVCRDYLLFRIFLFPSA